MSHRIPRSLWKKFGGPRGGIWLLFGLLACGGGQTPGRETGAGQEVASEIIPGTPPGSLVEWIQDIRSGLEGLAGRLQEDPQGASQSVTELYLSRQEYIERYYGAGGSRAGSQALGRVVVEAESRFHDLMRIAGRNPPPDSQEVAEAVSSLVERLREVLDEAVAAGVPLEAPVGGEPEPEKEESPNTAGPAFDPDRLSIRTAEVASMVEELRAAENAYQRGEATAALRGLEQAYLEGFEPLEARLPVAQVRRVESLIHLQLRPWIARGISQDSVAAAFATLYGEMQAVDDALSDETPFWLAAFNAFAIIFREGLEAVLLIGAMLAYLSRESEASKHRRQVYAGIGLGIAASLGTWLVARLIIPVGGASREMIEGITGLVAVAVLLYVSNWLFQKSYIHGWKEYLTERVGQAVSGGSALAMATLAFMAVYREGFETVLFYQALLFDAGPVALLTGFLPGLLLIGGVGVGIVRIGIRLPLKKTFAITNALLIYLAFVFVGKGIYNLQEAGLFAPTPLPWVPNHELSRQLLGIHPLAETLLAQAALLLLVAGSYLYYRQRARRIHSAGGAPMQRRSEARSLSE